MNLKLNNRFTAFAFFFLALTMMASATPVTISFTGLPSQTAGGYYVGYSQATITTPTNTFVNFDLMCDDFGSITTFPSGPFTYNVSTLADLTQVRFQQPNVLNNYRAAAILLYNFDGLGPVSASVAGDYNFALWELFSPAATPAYGNAATLLANAFTQVANGPAANAAAYSQLRIFTPTGKAISNQEFLGITTRTFGGSNVPEPATYAMLGSALIGLVFLRRKSL